MKVRFTVYSRGYFVKCHFEFESLEGDQSLNENSSLEESFSELFENEMRYCISQFMRESMLGLDDEISESIIILDKPDSHNIFIFPNRKPPRRHSLT
jgi:hypothetical protein